MATKNEMKSALDVIYPILKDRFRYVPLYLAQEIADDLLAKGCIFPPCVMGSKLYIAIEYGFDVTVDEATVTAVGLDRLWVSGCVPPGNDAGCEVLYSEIGKSAFWDRKDAERKAQEINGELEGENEDGDV